MFYAQVSFSAELCQQKDWQMKDSIYGLSLYLMIAMPFTALANTNVTNNTDAKPVISAVKEFKGVVVDENKAPIEFANVIVLNADSIYIAGAVTDENGVFVFNEIGESPGVVKVSSIGYSSQILNIPQTGDFGIITLTSESIMLGEVIVKSNRPVTAIKGDALVTNVVGTQLEHAGTAEDVLVQVPMVVGRDGVFEVFGKGSPAIYINGRLVQNSNELMQISSADIKNVEVVTNPGVKYDASVNSVIRITTKRPQGEGFSGLLRSTLRDPCWEVTMARSMRLPRQT